MYAFTLPVSGKKLTWKPVEVGRQLDIQAAHRGDAQRPYLTPALYAARVIQIEGNPQPGLQLHEMRSWDPIDYELFVEHIDAKESERRATFTRKQTGLSPVFRLEQAIENAKQSLGVLSQALSDSLDAAKAAELSAGPLSPG